MFSSLFSLRNPTMKLDTSAQRGDPKNFLTNPILVVLIKLASSQELKIALDIGENNSIRAS